LYRAIVTAAGLVVIDVRRSAAFVADNRMIVGATRLNPNAWGATTKFHSRFRDLRRYWRQPRRRRLSMRPRGDLQFQSSQIIGAVRWPGYYIGIWHRIGT
jgi:hypothetical protein